MEEELSKNTASQPLGQGRTGKCSKGWQIATATDPHSRQW